MKEDESNNEAMTDAPAVSTLRATDSQAGSSLNAKRVTRGPISVASGMGISNAADLTSEVIVAKIPEQPFSQVCIASFASGLMYVLALAPLEIGIIGFITVAPWAILVLDARRLGVRGYGVLTCVGLLTWSLIDLIERDAGRGSFATAAPLIVYLATYTPAFVYLGRLGLRVTRVPAYIWLPIVWASLEWLRSNLFGGFSLGLLAHSVVDSPRLLQIADLFGSYGLSAMMVALGASLAELLWQGRRLRRLERRLTSSQAGTNGDLSSPRTTPIPRPNMIFSGSENEKSVSLRSMEEAVRRNRDQTREFHFRSAAFSILVAVGVAVFGWWYGARRQDEISAWKMFESNQYQMRMIGGLESGPRFVNEMFHPARSMLVTSVLDEPSSYSRLIRSSQDVLPKSIRRPSLLISRRMQSEGSFWFASLHTKEEFRQIKIGNASGARWTLWRDGRHAAVIPKGSEIPVQLVLLVVPTSSIELILNDMLRRFPNEGMKIDAVVLTVEPGVWDGANWPRLMTRSVMAAAVANRCPVVAFVPEWSASAATGDGNLSYTSMGKSSRTVTGFEENNMGGGSFDLTAMMDPRTSLFVRLGDWPLVACTGLLVLTSIVGIWHQRSSASIR